MKKIVMGLIMLVIVVCVSGCATSNVDPKTDIVVDGEPQIHENGPLNEYAVDTFFHSASGTGYKDITGKITLYDSENNVLGVGTKTTTSSSLNSEGTRGDLIIVITNVKGTPSRAVFEVVNATKKA
jgi:hypothetical protein